MKKIVVRRFGFFILVLILLMSTFANVSALDPEREGKTSERAREFTDLPFNHWFRPTLHAVLYYGIMDGVSKTEFAPDAHVTRATVIKTLHNYRVNWELRTPDLPNPREVASERAPFKDVKPDAWYAEAVDWAYEKGIIKNAEGDLFFPDKLMTREEVAVMLKHYNEYTRRKYQEEVVTTERFESFIDCADVSPWAKDAMIWATGNRIFEGNPEKRLESKRLVTRAELGELMYNYSTPGHLPPGE